MERAPKLNPEQNFQQVPVLLLAGAIREEREQQQNFPEMGSEIGRANGHQTSQTVYGYCGFGSERVVLYAWLPSIKCE